MHKYTIPWSLPPPQAYGSPSLPDTAPQGPTSIQLSRHIHQNTQNLTVVETPQLQDTHHPGGVPSLRCRWWKWAWQGSALALSDPADGEPSHLPLGGAPGTPPSTPEACSKLRGDTLCQSLSVGCVQEGPPFMSGSLQVVLWPSASPGSPLPVPQAQAVREVGFLAGRASLQAL